MAKPKHGHGLGGVKLTRRQKLEMLKAVVEHYIEHAPKQDPCDLVDQFGDPGDFVDWSVMFYYFRNAAMEILEMMGDKK